MRWTRAQEIVGLVTLHFLLGILGIAVVMGIAVGAKDGTRDGWGVGIAIALAGTVVVGGFGGLCCVWYGEEELAPGKVSEEVHSKDGNRYPRSSQERDNNLLRAMEEGSQRVIEKVNHSQPDVPRNTQIPRQIPRQTPPGERGRLGCKLFTLEELERATRNFSEDDELGRGEFGIVYKGILRDGQVVAIKRANNKRTTNVEQYLNEVSILSQVSHHNFVKLLGCCLDEEVPLMVYEFISNGNLDEHLQNSQPQYIAELNWPCRLNIALQIAEALKYLHSQANPPIIHGDIKASNIMLDDQFTAKLADLRIPKLIEEGATSMSTVVKGTFGYLDPESRFTDKSDVYSYGIVLLELLTSRKPIDRSLEPGEQNLVVRSVPLIKKKRARDIMDPYLEKGFSKQDFDTFQAVAEVAVACLEKERSSRPSMSEVVEMLQKIEGSELKAE